MGIIPWNCIFVGIFLCIGVTNTVAYSKFGRKCSDIGCGSNQVCIIAEEPCTRGNNGACGQYPTCINKPAGGAPRRPGTGGQGNGDRGRPYVAPKPKPIPPTPPPRTSSNGYGSRYPYNIPKPIVSTPPPRPFSYDYGGRGSNSIGSRDPTWNRDYDGTNRGSGSGGRRGQSPSTYNRGQNNHNTHVSIDSTGNRVWTFSRSA